MKKTVNIESLLNNLDSNELKELKKQFNHQFQQTMHDLQQAEVEELRVFVNGLNLTNSWYENDQNVVSLSKWNLPIDQRSTLRGISDRISRAFKDLTELKADVAREAKRTGTPYSKVFHTSVRRMNRYRSR